MLVNTHMILANNLFKIANSNGIDLIYKNRFLWGKLKPDCIPKYKKIKHYYNESIAMIILKINRLSKLTISDINNDYGRGKFSEELGIICHFICDYFCLPHNKRWEFKNAMKKHVIYENTLAKIAKVYNPPYKVCDEISVEEIEKFIINKQVEYSRDKGFLNDLEFSYLVCNSIISMIVNQVEKNEYFKQRRAV